MQCPQCTTGRIRVETGVGGTGDGGRATHPLFCDNAECFAQFHGVGMHMRSTTAPADAPERLECDEEATRNARQLKERPDWDWAAHCAQLLERPTVEAWYEAELAKGLYRPGEDSKPPVH